MLDDMNDFLDLSDLIYFTTYFESFMICGVD